MNDLFSVAGKTALVTGGSRGIGLMIARAFVEQGATVYITSRDAEVCERAAADLRAHGDCLSLPADLSRFDEIERISEALKTQATGLDILINNAGATWGSSIEDFPERGWDKVMDLNLKSVFFLSQQLLPLLETGARADDPARIINLGSIDGLSVSSFENFSYSASKAAVHHLTRMLAARLAPRHITVNAIAPGPFKTPMMSATVEEMGDRIVESIPLGRFGEPRDIGGLAIFLASPASTFMTGTVIPLDGGLSAAR